MGPSTMSPRDVLHQLVDDLDESDALALASLAGWHDAGKPSPEFASLLTITEAKTLATAASMRAWSDHAAEVAHKLLAEAGRSHGGEMWMALVLRAGPPEALRNEITRCLLHLESMGEQGPARRRAVADALGSVRAEGLEPSADALRDAAEYEAGNLTADDLYGAALQRARSAAGR